MSPEFAKHLERAEKAIAKGKPELALEAYLEVLREDPKNDKVREAAADLCVTLNRPAEAAALLNPLFERLTAIGDVAHAVITFKKLARLETPAVEQWYRFGQLVERSSRREALEAYEAALKGLVQSGRRLEARPVLERIVVLEPSEQNYRRHGELALELGDNKAASAAFFEAGRMARRAGDDGVTWFQQAYAADPQNLPSALAYGRTLLDRGDAARVVAILERFASDAPTNQELGEIYGRALLATDRPRQAETFIWSLYQRDPSQVALVEQLLRAFLKDQEYVTALALARRLEASEHRLGRRRDFAKTLKDIADQHVLDVEFLEYLVQVFNNASREQDYCNTLLKLFDLYCAAGTYFKAGDALDRAAEVDPYEPGHQQRLERLRGKIDTRLFNAIANRFLTASSVKGPEPQAAQEDSHTTVLEDLVLQAEIFLQYSMRSKALERLERISKLFPHEEGKNQKVQQLFLAAGFSPKYQHLPRPSGMPAVAQSPTPAPLPQVSVQAVVNEESVDNFARVTEITRNIYRQGNVKSVLFTTANEVGRHWQASRCIAGLCAPGKPPSATLEYCAPGVEQADVMAIVRLIAALLPLAEQRALVSFSDAAAAPELANVGEVVAGLDIRSLVAVPLMDGERLVGMLILAHCGAPRQWRQADTVVLKTIADQVVQALQNARLRSLVKNLAVTDERSGLLKRSSYLDVLLSEVRRAQQQQSTVTVMLLCFGKPSALVKEWGEAAVRDLMLQIGQVLVANVRQSDMVVRYDLATIALILGDTTAKNAFFVADKMRKVLGGMKISGKYGAITMTAGIAEAAVQHSFDPLDIVTEVINRAEAALEIAQTDGGNKAHSIAPNLQSFALA
jgi:diguanylate cyclase (GGDEF)-like protein